MSETGQTESPDAPPSVDADSPRSDETGAGRDDSTNVSAPVDGEIERDGASETDRTDSPDVPAPVFVEIDRGDVRWRFEREFMTSNWTCVFGDGCKGILEHEAEALKQGCCSLGAHFGDGPAGRAEAMAISAMAALLTPQQWQYHEVGTTPWVPTPTEETSMGEAVADSSAHPDAGSDVRSSAGDEMVGDASDARPSETGSTVGGIFGDVGRSHTRVVDGACVFLNRPGFAGGVGCALHIAAIQAGESTTEWKPSVCWQLPLRVDWALVDENDRDGPETATVRRWTRADWGDHGRTMAWCCTEHGDGGEAYVGDERVVDSLADELIALAGDSVHITLRSALDPD